MVSCPIDSGLLSRFLDGEVDEFICRRVTRHLAACPACRNLLDDLRASDARVARLAEVERPVPYRVEAAIWDAVAARPRARFVRCLNLGRLFPAAAGTVAAALLVLAGMHMSSRPPSSISSPPPGRQTTWASSRALNAVYGNRMVATLRRINSDTADQFTPDNSAPEIRPKEGKV